MGMDKTASTVITGSRIPVLASFQRPSADGWRRHRHAAAGVVWNKDQKQRCLPAWPRQINVSSYALRGRLRLRRRHERPPRHALARRQTLLLNRREDVDRRAAASPISTPFSNETARVLRRFLVERRYAWTDRRRPKAQTGHCR